MPKYLVTGGAGFIGSNIVDLLVAQGEEVRVLDNFFSGYRKNIEHLLDKIELIEGDVRNPEDCARAAAGMDYILHQAALVSVPLSVEDPLLNHDTNITATLNVLIAARDAGVKRVVFAGSSAVYGNQDGEFKTEDMRIDAVSPYAAAKAASEHYLSCYSECFDIETVTLRYFNVFGPRQDPDSPYSAVIPIFIRAMIRGESPTVHGDGLQSRDFTFVENNVRANILAATAPIKARGPVYNIACGESYTLLELIDGINGALGTDIVPKHVESRVGDVRLSKACITQAREQLGYEVSISFEEGLRRTIEWYSEHGA